MMSTPRRSSCRAISSFSARFMLQPGDCSPSRRGVSKTKIFSGIARLLAVSSLLRHETRHRNLTSSIVRPVGRSCQIHACGLSPARPAKQAVPRDSLSFPSWPRTRPRNLPPRKTRPSTEPNPRQVDSSLHRLIISYALNSKVRRRKRNRFEISKSKREVCARTPLCVLEEKLMNTTNSRRSIARAKVLILLATLGLFCSGAALDAQTFRGAIVGTVMDQTEAPVPQARVAAKNQATGLTRTTATDDAGDFHLPELPLGDYTVIVEKEGFAPVTQANLRVDVGAERRLDVTLKPGVVQSVVEVTAGVPLLQTTMNTLGGTIEASQLANLPVNGRDYTKLIFMNPGVTGSPDQITDSPGSFGVFSVNGARGRSNNFLLDGTDMNDGYRNDPTINQAGVFGTPATILPVDAVAELAVVSNFMPEYGRNAGAVINIVTKSGTNDLHGTAAEYFRNDALGARNFFDPAPTPKTAFHNHQSGGSLGGPIVPDQTFFFAHYEGQRETGGLNSLGCVPSPDQTAAASVGITVNPVISDLLARHPWPAPNRRPAPFDTCPNLSATTHISNHVNSVIGKVDHNFNDSNLLTVRYYYGASTQSFPLGLQGGNNLPGYNVITPTNINLVSLSYVKVLSATRVNELRAGFNRFAETFFPEDRSFNPSTIGLVTAAGAQDFGLPTR